MAKEYSFDQLHIEMPEGASYILETLHRAGFEAYIVGGCVRDAVLGKDPEDWDITTSALPEQVKELFPHTVDTGIEHGTVMVLKGGDGYEVTTYRIDGKYNDSRHPETVEFTRSLTEDLKRRDFTINAFAYNEQEGIVDRFDGISDLNRGLIRCVGDPYHRFDEDALRIMRAVRFASQLSFRIETETRKAIEHFAERLENISRERIRVEFEKTLMSPEPGRVNQYAEMGLGGYIIGEEADKCFDAEAASIYPRISITHYPGVFEDPGDEIFCRKCLLLSVFFRDLSPETTGRVLRSLTYDNRTRNMVCKIIQYKDRPLPADRAEIRKALHAVGPQLLTLELDFQKAVHGNDRGYTAEETGRLLRDVLESGEAYQISMLKVDGRDMMDLGIPKGTAVGEALSDLLLQVLDDPGQNNREELLKLAKQLNKNG